MTSKSKRLFQESKYNIYERIDNLEPIEFMNQDLKKVMRYTFSEPSKIMGIDYLADKRFSFYNYKYSSNLIERVFHFNKIDNRFIDVTSEKYDMNVNSGFMTATFCYIILELLEDKQLLNTNFEINLVNNAKVRINGELTPCPTVYNKLLDDSDEKDNKNLFRGFLVENRNEDINYYRSVLATTDISIERDILASQFNYESCSESDIESIFEKRLLHAKETSVIKPFCIPNGYAKLKEDIILNDEVVLENDFSFYHHSEDEIVKFALENRENIKLHIDSMSDLYLDEYPAPNLLRRVFMVSTNGQHRRLVFECLGLERIRARIQFIKDKQRSWKYYFRKQNIPMNMVIEWLVSKGRIEKIEPLDSKTILIKDSSQLIPWILPDSEISSFSKIRKDILKRLQLIEKSFGSQDFAYGFIRQSGFLWYLDVHRVYLMNILRKFRSKV
ncbi:hypothetical protein [Streptococcus respiraculi]|uniref:hypothetical protein n=1 Tax=Streptococcus respiraculi TaxID=2021971 RepID=UPI000E76341E|nr:hypothetical protein [Streptococcus respiraculi]